MAKKIKEDIVKNIENAEVLPKVEKTKVVENIPKAEISNADLLQQIKDMQEKMALLMSINSLQGTIQQNQTIADKEEEVTSLTHGILNLATEGNGVGTIYRFESFGETQLIPLPDLKLIIKNNREFAQDGRFYFKNETLIKSSGLTGIYKRIIDKNLFEELFSLPRDAFAKIFTDLTEIQKNTFSELISTKIFKKEDIDMNMVAVVSEIIGKDILNEAKIARDIFTKTEN